MFRLYKALDKNDVVNGILKEKIDGHASEFLKKGLEYEQVGDWKNARETYLGEINQHSRGNTNSFEEQFIFDAYLKVTS